MHGKVKRAEETWHFKILHKKISTASNNQFYVALIFLGWHGNEFQVIVTKKPCKAIQASDGTVTRELQTRMKIANAYENCKHPHNIMFINSPLPPHLLVQIWSSMSYLTSNLPILWTGAQIHHHPASAILLVGPDLECQLKSLPDYKYTWTTLLCSMIYLPRIFLTSLSNIHVGFQR